jgi:hypothetical protein
MKKIALAALAAIALSGFTYKADYHPNNNVSGSNFVSHSYNWGMFLPKTRFAFQYIVPGASFLPSVTPGGAVCESTNGIYKLWFQTDGNLVLYKIGGIPLWSSNPIVTGASKVDFDGDGNVRAVRNVVATYWQSNTAITTLYPFPRIYWVLQDDGNFVRYYGTPGSPDLTKPSISTNTAGGVNSPNYGTFQ